MRAVESGLEVTHDIANETLAAVSSAAASTTSRVANNNEIMVRVPKIIHHELISRSY